MPKTAARRAAVFWQSGKKRRGGSQEPPIRAKVNKTSSSPMCYKKCEPFMREIEKPQSHFVKSRNTSFLPFRTLPSGEKFEILHFVALETRAFYPDHAWSNSGNWERIRHQPYYPGFQAIRGGRIQGSGFIICILHIVKELRMNISAFCRQSTMTTNGTKYGNVHGAWSTSGLILKTYLYLYTLHRHNAGTYVHTYYIHTYLPSE